MRKSVRCNCPIQEWHDWPIFDFTRIRHSDIRDLRMEMSPIISEGGAEFKFWILLRSMTCISSSIQSYILIPILKTCPKAQSKRFNFILTTGKHYKRWRWHSFTQIDGIIPPVGVDPTSDVSARILKRANQPVPWRWIIIFWNAEYSSHLYCCCLSHNVWKARCLKTRDYLVLLNRKI